jgi:hypothetical protein
VLPISLAAMLLELLSFGRELCLLLGRQDGENLRHHARVCDL